MKLRNLLAAFILILSCQFAFAQGAGQLGSKQIWFNPGTGTARGQPSSFAGGVNIAGNANYVTISGNTFNGFQQQAIQFAGTAGDFAISGNKITNFNLGGGGFAGIQILGANPTGTISGNVVDIGGGANSVGIWLSSTSQKINVTGNTVTNTNIGMLIDAGVTSYLVQSNLLHGNTTPLTDNGGAVNKLVQSNLN